MLASVGSPWTVIRTARRDAYMAALENAPVNNDIISFPKFVANEMAGIAPRPVNEVASETPPSPPIA
jgi:hypothetical protein